MISNTFENTQMISQPKEIKVSLFQHQLASIYQMEKRELDKQIRSLINNILSTFWWSSCF